MHETKTSESKIQAPWLTPSVTPIPPNYTSLSASHSKADPFGALAVFPTQGQILTTHQ